MVLCLLLVLWKLPAAASAAASEVFTAPLEMSVMVAASSSTELACSIEPWLRVCAPVETWLLAEATWPAAASIWRMVPLSWTFRLRMGSRIFWKPPT